MDNHKDDLQVNLFSNADTAINDNTLTNREDLTFVKQKAKSQKRYYNNIKCFRSELQEVNFMSFGELFDGFTTIKIITFSYTLSFIDKLVKRFNEAEIIIGVPFMLQKSRITQDVISDGLSNSQYVKDNLYKYENIIKMMKDGNLQLKVPKIAIDHRKMYILSADDGRTRVIYASANASECAWNGGQNEHVDYDDSRYAYEEAMKDFEAAWDLSCNVPFSVLPVSKIEAEKEDLVDTNIIVKEVKEVGRLTLLEEADMEPLVSIDRVEYIVEMDNLKEKYKTIMGNLHASDGKILLVPKTIDKFKQNYRKHLDLQRVKVNVINERYPKIRIDYDNDKILLNEDVLDLNPKAENVKSDLQQLVKVFSNFDNFIDHNGALGFTHFKLMSTMFISPFIAHLRCCAFCRDIGTQSMPLFLLLYSEGSNCGKTFMVKFILKMMTGKNLQPIPKVECNKDGLQALLAGSGTPFFIDEIDNPWIARIKDIIKSSDRCEQAGNDKQPMIVMASNNVVEPEEPIRKRLVYLKFDAGLSSTVDKSAYESSGKAIINRMDNALYREYLRRIYKKVNDLIDYMYDDTQEIPDSWYPDIFKLSSETIIEIFNDFGVQIPGCFKVVSWNEDYSMSASYDALWKLKEIYKVNKDSFIIKDNFVIIEFGAEDAKKVRSIVHTLPEELEPRLISTRENVTLSVKKDCLEKFLGIKLRKKFLGLF